MLNILKNKQNKCGHIKYSLELLLKGKLEEPRKSTNSSLAYGKIKFGKRTKLLKKLKSSNEIKIKIKNIPSTCAMKI